MSWEKPRRIDKELAAFELSNIPDVLAKLVKSCADTFQVPLDFVLPIVCSVIATATRGKIKIQVRADWQEPISLFTAPLLEPSNRKSAVIAFLTKPLRGIEKVFRIDHKELERVKRQRLEAAQNQRADLLKKTKNNQSLNIEADIALLDLIIEQNQETKTPCLLIDDTTPEALVEYLCDQGSLAYIEAEGQLVDNLSRYSDSQTPNVEALNKSWSSEPISVIRKGKAIIFNEKPHLVICIGAQPENVIPKLRDKQLTNCGFSARFWYSLGKSQVGSRVNALKTPEIAESVKNSWAVLITELFNQSNENPERVLIVSKPALEEICQLQDWLEPQLKRYNSELKSWGGKLVGNCIRIAAIFTLSENPKAKEITLESIKQAAQLAPVMIEHARLVFAPDKTQLPAVKLLNKLLFGFEGFKGVSTGGKIFTTNDLLQVVKDQSWIKYQANQARILRAELYSLENLGWVKQHAVETNPKGGRPSESWELHPEAELYFGEYYS
jgi:hypothetical protein